MRSIRRAPRQEQHSRRDGRSRQGRSRAARWLSRAAIGGAVLLATTGCQSNSFNRLGFLAPVTKQGQVTLTLWRGSWIAAFAVGFTVWGLIVWSVLFHRRRSDRVPDQVRYNLPIEALYTVLPFIMIGVLFFFTARDQNYIDKNPAHPQVVVNVTGFQWSWRFNYPQYKVPGSTYGNVAEVGQMWNGKVPGNQSQLPLLEIPAHETVRFNLRSEDVVHSFWVPPFEFKRDLIPARPNHFTVTPTKTGTFTGRCSELCGLYHSRMLFTVKIVTPAQFRAWVTAQQRQQTAAGGAQ